ncbi:MAG: bifunctional DNA-binding transcriptional regulator/O6-methylguanine-DNA methyltransferase Ada [Chloroflexi bacterium]|nr:bifunctional DNA-binding transcriptional regulator/O6-methylguanine-DNA methyltransferase Ada [Chloroflexota bacterium]
MDEEICWQAVLARDAGWDDRFVYGVQSTWIYCRPSCPSKRPHRDRVLFFPRPDAAEQAGFRPCLRCRPQDPGPGRELELVGEICRRIQGRPEEPSSLAALAAAAGIGPHHLQRTFKRVTGISPRQYAEACRLGLLKERLRDGQGVADALYEAGYGSSSRLYERAPLRLGMTPAVYRRGGRGVRIGYTIVDCPLGRLLMAATERGVCAISLGDSDDALEAELRREYPEAEIHRDDAGLTGWTGMLLGYMSGPGRQLDLPLEVRATAFQWRVWEELRAIPCGSTRSYGEIARSIGRPTAARAVARACAGNRLALVIPCHRAIRGDGDPGGYRWGMDRKQRLLARERAAAPTPGDHDDPASR